MNELESSHWNIITELRIGIRRGRDQRSTVAELFRALSIQITQDLIQISIPEIVYIPALFR